VSNSFYKRLTKLVIAFLGSIAFRYPVWAMLVDAGDIRGVKPWDSNFGLLCSWDCSLYAGLSTTYRPEDSAFFPVFPLMIRGLNQLFPHFTPELCTLILSNVFTVLAGMLVLYLGDLIWNERGYKKFFFSYKSWLSLFILSVFPTAHFWVRGFSEPVFVVLLLLIFHFILRSKWLLASGVAGLCAVLRPQGVWIAGIFGIIFLFNLRKELLQKPWPACLAKACLGVLLAGLPFCLFMYWLWVKTGDPFHFYRLQQGWGRHFSLTSGIWDNRPRVDSDAGFLYLSLCAAFFMIKRGAPHWIFLGMTTLALAELPLFLGGFLSYSRFMSANIGLMFFSAEIISTQPALAVALIAYELTHLAINTYHAGFGMWSG
jgi:hypothetical protein